MQDWTAGDSDGLGEAKTDGAHSLAGLDARDVATVAVKRT